MNDIERAILNGMQESFIEATKECLFKSWQEKVDSIAEQTKITKDCETYKKLHQLHMEAANREYELMIALFNGIRPILEQFFDSPVVITPTGIMIANNTMNDNNGATTSHSVPVQEHVTFH